MKKNLSWLMRQGRGGCIDSHLVVTENAHGLRTHASLDWINSIAVIAVVFAYKHPVKLCNKAMLMYPFIGGDWISPKS